MKFLYRAKDRQGTQSSGDIDAANLAEARQRLRSQGLFILEIEAKSTRNVLQKKVVKRGGKVAKADLVLVLSQLTIMCQSGEDLAEALKSLAQQCPKPALQQVLFTVFNDVSAGISFSEALQKHPHVFDDSFVAGIAAGEHSGTITSVLERLTNLLRSDMKLRSTIWSMMMYPILLGSVTVLVMNAIIFFVLPQFAKVFEDMGKETPPLTNFLLGIGDVARGYYWVFLIIGAAMAWGWTIIKKSIRFQRIVDSIWLNFKFVKNTTRALYTGRSYKLLGTMLESGVPLVEGIRLCRAATKNILFKEMFDRVEHNVLHGEGMGKALLAAEFLPQGAANMIVTAERTGKLAPVMQSVGEYYEEEGERYLRDMVKLMEPIIIVSLGAVVSLIVLAIVVPLLDVTTMTG